MKKIICFFLILLTGPFLCLGEGKPADYLKGQLSNGLTYYLHEIPDSETVSFFLVENAGSINEDDSQSGLAHFLEHLAFRGTKNFPGRSLIDYLQSQDVKFGVDLNAVTSYEKTVFKIENVAAKSGLVDSCLLILKDWSNAITNDPEEMEAERKVITQEWRTTASSGKRIRQQFAHQLLEKENPYRYKTPIGNMDSINSFHHEELVKFYKKWYRPDFQAIIVEGNINPNNIENRIKELWEDIEAPADSLKFTPPTLEDFKGPRVGIASDNELRNNSIDIQLLKLYPNNEESAETYYADFLKKEIIASILSTRLRERAWKNDSIIKGGSAYNGNFIVVDTQPAFTIGVSYSGKHHKDALDTLVYEIKRLNELGVTESELAAQKEELRGKINFLENEDLNKQTLSDNFIDNYTRGIPVTTPSLKKEVLSSFIDTITLQGLNFVLKELINPTGDNAVLLLRVKDDERSNAPSDREMIEEFYQAWQQDVLPYRPMEHKPIVTKELILRQPEKGEIIKEETDTMSGARKYILPNSGRVYFQKLDNEDNSLILSAISKGSSSFDFPDPSIYSMTDNIIKLSGLGENSAEDIRQITEREGMKWNILTDTNTQRIIVRGSKDNPEKLFQILYLAITSPGKDSVNFENWKKSYSRFFEMQTSNPSKLLSDSISKLLYGEKVTGMPDPKDIEKLNYEKIAKEFKNSFSDTSELDFIIVGDIDANKMKELTQTYLASLPAISGKEKFYAPLSLPYPRGVKETIIYGEGGVNNLSSVTKTIMGSVENTLKNRLTFSIFKELLKDLYLKEIRNNSGSFYSVNVSGEISRLPENLLTLNINFTTGDKDYESLFSKLNSGIEEIANGNVDEVLLGGLKTGLRKDYESFSRTTDYQFNRLQEYLLNASLENDSYLMTLEGIDRKDIIRFAKLISEAPTDVNVVVKY